MAILSTTLLISCSKDSQEQVSETNANLTVQQNNWKTATITNEVVENQKNISHYSFNIAELSSLVSQKEVTYVWFDIGLNKNNQLTFAATGVNEEDIVFGEVASTIVSTYEYKADFSIFNQVKDVVTESDREISHILKNQDAFNYLTGAVKSLDNLEATLTQNEIRIERFGLEARIIEQMLQTNSISDLALFLGLNKKQQMTTVFVAKDKEGQFIITNGGARDFTAPCPTYCDIWD